MKVNSIAYRVYRIPKSPEPERYIAVADRKDLRTVQQSPCQPQCLKYREPGRGLLYVFTAFGDIDDDDDDEAGKVLAT